MADSAVRVEGLAELNRSLRDIDRGLASELRGTFRRLAAKARDGVRSRMPSKTGRARGAVRSSSTSRSSYVASGKSSVPYTPWLDFGGVLRPSGARRNTITRPQVKGGRYLYPTLDQMRPQIEREAIEAIENVKARLGLSD